MLAFALVLACTMSAMGQPKIYYGKGDTGKPDDRGWHERDKEILDRAVRLETLVQKSRLAMVDVVNAVATEKKKKKTLGKEVILMAQARK